MKAMAQRHIHPRAEREIPDILDRLCKYEAYKLPADIIQELYIQLCTQEEGLSDEKLDRLDNLPRGRMGRQVQRGREAYYKAQIENGGNELTDSRKKTVIVGALGLENRPQSTSNANGVPSAFVLCSPSPAYSVFAVLQVPDRRARRPRPPATRPPPVVLTPSLILRLPQTKHRLKVLPGTLQVAAPIRTAKPPTVRTTITPRTPREEKGLGVRLAVAGLPDQA